MPTDQAALVNLAKGGDRAAFDELVRRRTPMRTPSPTGSLGTRKTRDVVQDAYLRAFRSIRKFRGDVQFSTWMYRIVANCAATTLGKRNRHRHEELPDDGQVSDDRPDADPALLAEAGAMRNRVDSALKRLPPRLRAVVVLRDVYDMPHEAIAAELGITEAAAKVRLHRARRRLREQPFRCAEMRRKPVRSDALTCERRGRDPACARRRRSRRPPPRPPRRRVPALPGRAGPVPQALRAMHTLRTEVLEPAPGLFTDILAHLEAAGERRAIRSMLHGRRGAYIGGLAAATAAGAAGAAIVLVSRRASGYASPASGASGE